jgi:hypothetical protein
MMGGPESCQGDEKSVSVLLIKESTMASSWKVSVCLTVLIMLLLAHVGRA